MKKGKRKEIADKTEGQGKKRGVLQDYSERKGKGIQLGAKKLKKKKGDARPKKGRTPMQSG